MNALCCLVQNSALRKKVEHQSQQQQLIDEHKAHRKKHKEEAEWQAGAAVPSAGGDLPPDIFGVEDWFGVSVPPSAAGPHDGSMHDFRHLLGPGCDSSKDGSSAPPGMFNPPQPPLPSLTQQWGEHRQHHHHHHHHHHRGAGGLAPPRPPPSSTPMVAMTAPPAQLQMPLMSLQPRMNATEAMAALSAANCDVVKKVGGSLEAAVRQQ